jgi:lipopolysaccharide transport system permease protein
LRRPAYGGFDTSQNSVWHQIRELVRYADLIKLLAFKDLKLRYKGSVLGFLWSLINPLLMTLVYYIVFIVLLPVNAPPGCSQLAPNGATPEQIQGAVQCKIANNFTPFIFIGILAWNFTAGSITSGMTSILHNSSIVKKVYFPREVLPLSSVLSQFLNFLLALIPLSIVLGVTGNIPNGYVLLLPVIFVAHILFLAGIALIMSVLVLYLRDLLVIMEVILQAWFFLSPVIYSMDQVYKDAKQIVYWLNPVASFIESYRTLLFFHYPPDLLFTLRTCMVGVVTFIIGFGFFMWRRKKIGEML